MFGHQILQDVFLAVGSKREFVSACLTNLFRQHQTLKRLADGIVLLQPCVVENLRLGQSVARCLV